MGTGANSEDWDKTMAIKKYFSDLSPCTNPTKWSMTLKEHVFDHFPGLALKGLSRRIKNPFEHFRWGVLRK